MKTGTLTGIGRREPDKEVVMARRFYPAVNVQDSGDGADDGYGVRLADFPGCVSGLDTIRQAAAMAAEALSGNTRAMVGDNDAIPEPSDPGLLPHWFDPVRLQGGRL